MKKLITILILLIIGGCRNKPVSTEQTNNSEFVVEELFTYDSITVYRFHDGGDAVYFCRDWTRSTYSCGKNCWDSRTVETK